jgi:hypothetical protein
VALVYLRHPHPSCGDATLRGWILWGVSSHEVSWKFGSNPDFFGALDHVNHEVFLMGLMGELPGLVMTNIAMKHDHF